LRCEAEYFLSCITSGERPENDGHAGLRVVKLLEACSQSLKQGGKSVPV
jgi:predicted dehydrogenase